MPIDGLIRERTATTGGTSTQLTGDGPIDTPAEAQQALDALNATPVDDVFVVGTEVYNAARLQAITTPAATPAPTPAASASASASGTVTADSGRLRVGADVGHVFGIGDEGHSGNTFGADVLYRLRDGRTYVDIMGGLATQGLSNDGQTPGEEDWESNINHSLNFRVGARVGYHLGRGFSLVASPFASFGSLSSPGNEYEDVQTAAECADDTDIPADECTATEAEPERTATGLRGLQNPKDDNAIAADGGMLVRLVLPLGACYEGNFPLGVCLTGGPSYTIANPGEGSGVGFPGFDVTAMATWRFGGAPRYMSAGTPAAAPTPAVTPAAAPTAATSAPVDHNAQITVGAVNFFVGDTSGIASSSVAVLPAVRLTKGSDGAVAVVFTSAPNQRVFWKVDDGARQELRTDIHGHARIVIPQAELDVLTGTAHTVTIRPDGASNHWIVPINVYASLPAAGPMTVTIAGRAVAFTLSRSPDPVAIIDGVDADLLSMTTTDANEVVIDAVIDRGLPTELTKSITIAAGSGARTQALHLAVADFAGNKLDVGAHNVTLFVRGQPDAIGVMNFAVNAPAPLAPAAAADPALRDGSILADTDGSFTFRGGAMKMQVTTGVATTAMVTISAGTRTWTSPAPITIPSGTNVIVNLLEPNVGRTLPRMRNATVVVTRTGGGPMTLSQRVTVGPRASGGGGGGGGGGPPTL